MRQKGNRKKKKKKYKKEINRREVRSRSEIEMRTGKAFLKAKGKNAGCKANEGTNREDPATN